MLNISTVNEAVFEFQTQNQNQKSESDPILKLKLLSDQSLQNHSSSLNIYVDRSMSNTIHLTTQIEQGTAFVFQLNILAQFGFVCVHPWVLVPGFSHYMPGCVTGYLFPATGRRSPLLLSVWHHFLLDGSIYHPTQEHPLSFIFRGRLFTHERILMPLCSLEM